MANKRGQTWNTFLQIVGVIIILIFAYYMFKQLGWL